MRTFRIRDFTFCSGVAGVLAPFAQPAPRSAVMRAAEADAEEAMLSRLLR